MHRLPLLNMCSRETKRLPVENIVDLLQCEAMLPLERRQSVTSIKPSERFFVYYYYPWEIGLDSDTGRSDGGAMFLLVEVYGTKETVLDHGEAGSSTVNGAGYQHFEVVGEKIGRYEFYCPSDGWERFHIDDIVNWNVNCLPRSLPSQKAKYGDGPFKVVAVRLHTREAQRDGFHPEAVTIEYKPDQRTEMSGDWFTKK